MSEWKLVKSRVPGKVPSVNQVDEDTLALNQADGKLYVLRINGATKEVVLIAGGDPVPGPAGADGRELELSANATHLLWRYVGDESWLNLVSLDDITGPTGEDGREIELSANATHLLWRYVGEITWNELVAVANIEQDPIAMAALNLHKEDKTIHRQMTYSETFKSIIYTEE